MYEDLQTLASLKFDKAADAISQESLKRQQDVVQEMQSKGRSSTEFLKMEFQSERVERTCKVLAEIWSDLIVKREGALSESGIEFIMQQVERVANEGTSGQESGIHNVSAASTSAKQERVRRAQKTVARLRREFEIQRQENRLFPSL